MIEFDFQRYLDFGENLFRICNKLVKDVEIILMKCNIHSSQKTLYMECSIQKPYCSSLTYELPISDMGLAASDVVWGR